MTKFRRVHFMVLFLIMALYMISSFPEGVYIYAQIYWSYYSIVVKSYGSGALYGGWTRSVCSTSNSISVPKIGKTCIYQVV